MGEPKTFQRQSKRHPERPRVVTFESNAMGGPDVGFEAETTLAVTAIHRHFRLAHCSLALGGVGCVAVVGDAARAPASH